MTGLEFVREVFPDATKDEAEYLLWNATAYPMGDITHNRNQLLVYKATIDAGKHPCEWCNEPVEEGRRDSCIECSARMMS